MKVQDLITRLQALDPNLDVGYDASVEDEDGRYYTPAGILEIRIDVTENKAVAVLGWLEE